MSAERGEAVAGMSKHRIEMLVDGIFAVAMTLLVLDIKMPETVTYASEADLWRKIVSLEHAMASYVVSFLMLSVYWVAHHFHFHFIERTDRGLLWINLYLLLCITLVPFTTDLLGDNVQLHLPALLYGVNLLLVAAAFIAQAEYLARHGQLASPALDSHAITLLRRRAWLMTIIPAVSMAMAFYSPRLALYLYLTLPLLHIVPGGIDRAAMRSAGRALRR
jgi:uncharacterized membrane protein